MKSYFWFQEYLNPFNQISLYYLNGFGPIKPTLINECATWWPSSIINFSLSMYWCLLWSENKKFWENLKNFKIKLKVKLVENKVICMDDGMEWSLLDILVIMSLYINTLYIKLFYFFGLSRSIKLMMSL